MFPYSCEALKKGKNIGIENWKRESDYAASKPHQIVTETMLYSWPLSTLIVAALELWSLSVTWSPEVGGRIIAKDPPPFLHPAPLEYE